MVHRCEDTGRVAAPGKGGAAHCAFYVLPVPRSVYFLRQTPGGRALIDKWYDIRKHEQAQNAHDQDGLYHYLSKNNEVGCAPHAPAPSTCIAMQRDTCDSLAICTSGVHLCAAM